MRGLSPTAGYPSPGILHQEAEPSKYLDLKASGKLFWWYSGKDATCQCRVHGFNPWSGKIPHAAGQLSPCATTIKANMLQLLKPMHQEPLLCSRRSHCNEKPMHCVYSSPHSPQLEKDHVTIMTQHSRKIKTNKIKKASQLLKVNRAFVWEDWSVVGNRLCC